MASMFRACKYETYDELKVAFVNEQIRRNTAGGRTVIKIISKAGVSQNMGDMASLIEDSGAEMDDTDEKKPLKAAEKDDDDDESDDGDQGDDDGDDGEDESVADESDVDI